MLSRDVHAGSAPARRLPSWRWLAPVVLPLLAVAAALWLTRPAVRDPLLYTVAIPLTPSQNVALAVDEYTRRAFVASGEAVDVLALDTGALLRTVRTRFPGDTMAATGSTWAALAVDVRTNRTFAVNYDNDRVVTLDARSGRVLNSVTVNLQPGALAIDDRTRQVFVAGDGGHDLDAVDTRTGSVLQAGLNIAVNGFPDGLAVDPGTGHGFAAQEDGTVLMFDPRTDTAVHSEWGSANPFYSLTVDTRDERVFACGDGSRNVSVFDARSDALLPAIPVGDNPVAVAVDERTGRAFTSNAGDGTVSVLDTRSLSVVQTVAVGPNPVVAVDERRGRVGIASDAAVSVLDARSGMLVRTNHLALAPLAIAIDTQTGHVLVVSAGTTRRVPDPWAWVPRPLRGWLPFLPPARPHMVTTPPSVAVLDEALLAGG